MAGVGRDFARQRNRDELEPDLILPEEDQSADLLCVPP